MKAIRVATINSGWSLDNRVVDTGDASEYQRMHVTLGCPTCRFADPQALGKGPCCQRVSGPEIKGDKCLSYLVENI